MTTAWLKAHINGKDYQLELRGDEIRRAQRGSTMMSADNGPFSPTRYPRWDQMTPEQRAEYQEDFEWLCKKLDDLKTEKLK